MSDLPPHTTVRARLEGQTVTGLLISTVTLVHFMHVDLDAFQGAGDGDGIVAASVIHQNDRIDQLLVPDLAVSLAKGFGRIISGHDDDNFFIAEHIGAVNAVA